MSAQVAADLRAAADVLRRDGWTQGGYKRCGCYCLVGATVSTITDGAFAHPLALQGDDEWRRYSEMWDVLQRALGDPPATWNDAVGRTADEVIAALLAAADVAEAQS